MSKIELRFWAVSMAAVGVGLVVVAILERL